LETHDSSRDSQKNPADRAAPIRIVTETLAGQYHSVFKGQGMNFDEVSD
jgi:hypothetical protein